MTKIDFYDPFYMPSGKLTYSVIAAEHNGRWIFVRHAGRETWEIAGGHIEEGESPEEAAVRELREETGAEEFNIECVATYSVEKNSVKGYGRLFLAEVFKTGLVPDVSEIAEVKLSDRLPENLTYPDIQPHLFRKVIEFMTRKT